MTVVAAEKTELMGIEYPGEESDPFWDQWVNMMNQIDLNIFMRKIKENLFIAGGGSRTWNGGSGVFSWTQDFCIPVYHWGKRVFVRYGPDGATRGVGLQDGQALVVQLPVIMNSDVTVNFSVVDRLNVNKEEQWVAGWRYGGALQLKGIGELT